MPKERMERKYAIQIAIGILSVATVCTAVSFYLLKCHFNMDVSKLTIPYIISGVLMGITARTISNRAKREREEKKKNQGLE